MEIRGVDDVAVLLSQVSQQRPQRGVVPGKNRQVDGAAAIFVQEAGVSPGPQQHLHHLHLPGDHGQVERSLQEEEEVTVSATV